MVRVSLRQAVSHKALAGAASRFGLAEHARIRRGLDRKSLLRSVLANLDEGVVGAVHLDAAL